MESGPALSPNGRFLAYTAYQSDEYQVYVRPFPNVLDRRVQVSIERGIEPVWARNGRELFYRKGEGGNMVAVEVETADSFRIGEEHLLFPAGRYRANPLHSEYDVTPDGQRFVMLRPLPVADPTQEPRMILIQNWFTESEERLGR